MLMRSMFYFLVMAMAIPGAALAGEGERLLNRFLTDTKTMSAAFTQTLMSEDGRLMQQSSGTFSLQRPGRFRWDYAQPYQQQIISSGDKIYVYDVELEQVTVQDTSTTLSNTPMALMEGRLELEKSFRVEELDHRDGTWRLKLHSKQPDGDFNFIIVGVDDSGLRFLQLTDQFNQKTDIVFSDLETNIELDAARFRFEAPAGVDIFGDG